MGWMQKVFSKKMTAHDLAAQVVMYESKLKELHQEQADAQRQLDDAMKMALMQPSASKQVASLREKADSALAMATACEGAIADLKAEIARQLDEDNSARLDELKKQLQALEKASRGLQIDLLKSCAAAAVAKMRLTGNRDGAQMAAAKLHGLFDGESLKIYKEEITRLSSDLDGTMRDERAEVAAELERRTNWKPSAEEIEALIEEVKK